MIFYPRILRGLSAAIALVGLLAFSASAHAAEPMTLEQFREVFSAAVSKRYPQVTVTAEGETFLRLKASDGAGGRVDITKTYRQYLTSQETLDAILEAHVGMLAVAFPSGPRVAAENLVVMVKGPSRAGDTASAPGLERQVAGDIGVYLAFDLDKVQQTASADDLKTLGLGLDQAWERAGANGVRMEPLRKGRLSTPSQPDGVVGPNAFSRLFSNPATCGAPGAGRGDPRLFLLLAPAVYVTGDPASPDSLARFWKMVAEVAQKPDALSRTPVTCASGRWAVATSGG